MKTFNLNKLKKNREKIEQEVKKRLTKVSSESKKVLRDLGVKSVNPKLTISDMQEILADIRHFNHSPKLFIRNLDYATYDSRQQLSWSTNMLLAYAKQYAKQKVTAYEADVSPKISTYKEQLNKQFSKVKRAVLTPNKKAA